MTTNAQRLRDATWPYLRDMRVTPQRGIGLAVAGIGSMGVAVLATWLGAPDRVVSDLVVRGQILDLTLAAIPAALIAVWLVAPYATRGGVGLGRATAVMALLVVALTDLLASLYLTLPALWTPLDLGAWVAYPMALLAAIAWGAFVYGIPGLAVAFVASLPCVAAMRAWNRR